MLLRISRLDQRRRKKGPDLMNVRLKFANAIRSEFFLHIYKRLFTLIFKISRGNLTRNFMERNEQSQCGSGGVGTPQKSSCIVLERDIVPV